MTARNWAGLAKCATQWYTFDVLRGLPVPDLTPDQFRTFYLLPTFVRRWDALGLTDEDLAALQWQVMAGPDAGVVVKGAAGLRKVRFALPGRGKSGAYRVYYTHLPGHGVVVLAVAFGKGEAADIPAPLRRALVDGVTAISAYLTDRRQ